MKLIISIAAVLFSSQLMAQEMTALEIMQKTDDMRLQSSDSSFNKMKLTSCKYGVKNGKVKCVEKPRIKTLESVSISQDKDTKSVMIVLEPSSEKGIGMLSYSYDDPEKDNETWLYLSALGKVKRIASSNSDDDSESASLFGSEFSTEDQETGKLEEYSWKILEETKVSGRDVWKIESIPNPKRAKNSAYAKTIMYIDKERFVGLKYEMYDQYDKQIRQMTTSKVEKINDVWMARSLTMYNKVSNRLSNMAILDINLGIDVSESFLTQRTLTDVAYRESELSNLRKQIK